MALTDRRAIDQLCVLLRSRKLRASMYTYHMNVQRILRSKWLSSGLIVAGLFLLGLSYYQQISQEIWYWWKDQQGTYITVDPTLPDANNKVVTIEPKSTDFGLVIEKIGVNEPIAADVDPFNQNEYLSILEQTPVAEASLSSQPGQPGMVYLFGHSTVNLWEIGRYKAPFTLLHKLDNNDRIIVYHKGERFNYRVSKKEVVAPTNVEVLTAAYKNSVLVLQTCDPPGENTERLLVYAELEKTESSL